MYQLICFSIVFFQCRKVKREPGENPGRSGHCEQRAFKPHPLRVSVRRRLKKRPSCESGNLLKKVGHQLPEERVSNKMPVSCPLLYGADYFHYRQDGKGNLIMKNSLLKNIVCLAICILLVVSLPLMAFAEDDAAAVAELTDAAVSENTEDIGTDEPPAEPEAPDAEGESASEPAEAADIEDTDAAAEGDAVVGDAAVIDEAAADGQPAVNEPAGDDAVPAEDIPKAANGLNGESKGESDLSGAKRLMSAGSSESGADLLRGVERDSSTALDEVLAAIGELSADPRDFTAADRESVEAINAAFEALSAEDQATVDSTKHPADSQSCGRILEAALWAVRSFSTDTSTTLLQGTYTATTDPAVSSSSSKGKSDSSRVRNWWVESVDVDANGKATANIYVTSGAATASKLTSYPSVWIGGQTINRAADNTYPIPVDLNGVTYFCGISESMPRPIMYALTTNIDEPSSSEETVQELSVSNTVTGLSVTGAEVRTRVDSGRKT